MAISDVVDKNAPKAIVQGPRTTGVPREGLEMNSNP